MIVISDSSVLIGLSSVDQLRLLKELLNDEICIPGAVWHEVVETGAGRPGSKRIESADWITVMQVAETDLLCLLKMNSIPVRQRLLLLQKKYMLS